MTYQEMTAIPKKALKQLKTIATIPFGVKPAGNGPGGSGAPVKSRRSRVFPAALPTVGISWALQASKWSGGMERDDWRREGASIMVAMRPEATCHSMWQWKYQMRGERLC